jgi:hypothetical protein
MTPKIWASIKAIRAISHQFAQRQTAIRWLEWLHRKLSSCAQLEWRALVPCLKYFLKCPSQLVAG